MQQGDQVRIFPPAGQSDTIHLLALAVRMVSSGEKFRAQLPDGDWWWGTDQSVISGLLSWQNCFVFRADWVSTVVHKATSREGDTISSALPDQADRLPGTWAP